MDILRGYGMVPNLYILLGQYWDKQRIVPKAGNFLGRKFGMGRGIRQGNPLLTIIFNIMVYEVVRSVLAEVCWPEEVHHGLG